MAEEEDATAQASLQSKIDKIVAAIDGWQKVLDHMDNTREQARLGTLAPVNGLLPDELVEDVKTLDGGSDSAAADRLQKVNVISITGGGHTFTFEETLTESLEAHGGVLFDTEIDIGGNVGVTAGFGPAAFKVAASFGVVAGISGGSMTTKGNEVERVKGFTLGDPDSGDKVVCCGCWRCDCI